MQEVENNSHPNHAEGVDIINSEGNITHEVRITFRASGIHRSKTKSTARAVLFVLRRVDKKDA